MKKKKKKARKGKPDESEYKVEEEIRQKFISEAPVEEIEPENEEDVEIEYIQRDEYLLTGKYYEEFKNVFQYFAPAQDNEDEDGEKGSDEEEQEEKKAEEPKEKTLSKKKRKLLKRMQVLIQNNVLGLAST